MTDYFSITDGFRSPDETARIIGCKKQTLANWRHTGRHSLPFVKVGGRIFYRDSDLKDWIAGRVFAGKVGEK